MKTTEVGKNHTAAPAAIPVLELKTQTSLLRAEVLEALARVVDSGQFIHGPDVGAFEDEMRQYCQASTAVAVASGTDALVLALQALGLGGGDEVITSPFTFFATAEAIVNVGAVPVFADIDPATFNIDPASVESRITPRTRAIVPVHLFGLSADMDPILEIARRHGLKVIEDAAQAAGARYHGRPVGGLGDAGCFSFYPTKNLGGMGDGGMIVLQDIEVASRIRQIANHGQRPGSRYFYDTVGTNSRLDSMQAAVLRLKLRHLDAWNQRRRTLAARYRELLEGSNVQVPVEPAGSEHIYHLFTVRCASRDRLAEHLRAAGIGTMVYYPLCLHAQQAFQSLGYREGDFPQAEQAQREVLSLPMYPELSMAGVERVAKAIHEFKGGSD